MIYSAIPDDSLVGIAEWGSGRIYHGRIERAVLDRSLIPARQYTVCPLIGAKFIITVNIDELHVFDLAVRSNVSKQIGGASRVINDIGKTSEIMTAAIVNSMECKIAF